MFNRRSFWFGSIGAALAAVLPWKRAAAKPAEFSPELWKSVAEAREFLDKQPSLAEASRHFSRMSIWTTDSKTGKLREVRRSNDNGKTWTYL